MVWWSNLLTEAPQDVNTVVGQRVCLPGATKGWQALAATGRYQLVYEVDDDLLDVDPSNGPAWAYFSKPEIRSNIKRNIQVADAVTVTTEPLAERVRQLNPNIHVIPNAVPASLLDLPTPVAADDPVTIGWGGGMSHQMDWAEADSEIARFVTRNTTTEMHLMGWQPPDLWRRLPSTRRRYTPWVDAVPDLYRSIDFQIGVAPLRPHLFNQAKSPVKALEMAALGIPCIASDVGPYSGFVRHGETGFLVRRPHEWARYLRQLLDPVARQEMGDKARALVADYTIETNIELWEKALIG
jgi:glycosyltransferase involved in cell wall biosynthesis